MYDVIQLIFFLSSNKMTAMCSSENPNDSIVLFSKNKIETILELHSFIHGGIQDSGFWFPLSPEILFLV